MKIVQILGLDQWCVANSARKLDDFIHQFSKVSTICPIRKGGNVILIHPIKKWISTRSGGEFDSGMFAVAVEYMAPIILMHMSVASEWNKSLKHGDNLEMVGAGDKTEKRWIRHLSTLKSLEGWCADLVRLCNKMNNTQNTMPQLIQICKKKGFMTVAQEGNAWNHEFAGKIWVRGGGGFTSVGIENRAIFPYFSCSRWVITFSSGGKQQKLRVYHVGTSCGSTFWILCRFSTVSQA